MKLTFKERKQKMEDTKVFLGDKNKYTSIGGLGEGGNGVVYKVKDQNGNKYALKSFKFQNRDDNEKRFKRFIKEVDTLEYLSKRYRGYFIPIVDKKLPNEYDASCVAWYVMPIATKFDVTQKRDLNEKLDILIGLSQILVKMHEERKYHRDIKPENILFYNNRYVLTDFGLVWTENDERLTWTNERIGPYRILPNELRNVDTHLNISFNKSDVYLFCKVIWMLLKNDNNGFYGKYNRNDSQIYINKNELLVDTLEPLHELLTIATDDDVNIRPEMATVYKVLIEQRNLLNNSSKYDASLYREKEYILLKRETLNFDKLIINDKLVIADFLTESVKEKIKYIIYDSHFEKKYKEFLICEAIFINDYYEISTYNNDSLLFDVKELIFEQNSVTLKLSNPKLSNKIPKYDILFPLEKSYLDGSYCVVCVISKIDVLNSL